MVATLVRGTLACILASTVLNKIIKNSVIVEYIQEVLSHIHVS